MSSERDHPKRRMKHPRGNFARVRDINLVMYFGENLEQFSRFRNLLELVCSCSFGCQSCVQFYPTWAELCDFKWSMFFFNHFSYFQFVKVEKPAVYSMKKQEIVERLENIATEVMPDDENWRDHSVKDLVLKYKVRVTNNSA